MLGMSEEAWGERGRRRVDGHTENQKITVGAGSTDIREIPFLGLKTGPHHRKEPELG